MTRQVLESMTGRIYDCGMAEKEKQQANYLLAEPDVSTCPNKAWTLVQVAVESC